MKKYLVVRYTPSYDDDTGRMEAVAPALIEAHDAVLCELADEDVKTLQTVTENGSMLKALEVVEPNTVAELLAMEVARAAEKRRKAAIAEEARAKKREERKAREAAAAAELERRLFVELQQKYGTEP